MKAYNSSRPAKSCTYCWHRSCCSCCCCIDWCCCCCSIWCRRPCHCCIDISAACLCPRCSFANYAFNSAWSQT